LLFLWVLIQTPWSVPKGETAFTEEGRNNSFSFDGRKNILPISL
jgi:hypothetical protein